MAEATVPEALDDIDLALLIQVSEAASVREMCAYVDRGVASIHARLRKLENLGMILPPPSRGMHRRRNLTELGKRYVKANLNMSL